jgi:hypothetical protein
MQHLTSFYVIPSDDFSAILRDDFIPKPEVTRMALLNDDSDCRRGRSESLSHCGLIQRHHEDSRAARALRTSNELARKHGLQRGEFIRQLILDELARDSGDPPVSVELVEILGLRLMLTNLLKPLARQGRR